MQKIKYKALIEYKPAKDQEVSISKTFDNLKEAEEYINIKCCNNCEIKLLKIIETEEIIKQWIN